MGIRFKFLAWELQGPSPWTARLRLIALCARLSPGRGTPFLLRGQGTQSESRPAQGRRSGHRLESQVQVLVPPWVNSTQPGGEQSSAQEAWKDSWGLSSPLSTDTSPARLSPLGCCRTGTVLASSQSL